MATERLPAARYIAKLNKIRSELDWWEATYETSAQEPEIDGRAGALARRAELLQIIQADLGTAIEHLRGLPRLS